MEARSDPSLFLYVLEEFGPGGGSRTHTGSDPRQILSLLRLPVPPLRENVMRIVPVVKSSDLQRSLHFYTEVLDFERKWLGHEDREMANGVIDLVRDGAELQLSRHSGDGVFGSVNRVFVDDVDERYVTFRTRGLNTTERPESPIHTAPIDQTWGLREFAVTDPDGNGLCFCMPKR